MFPSQSNESVRFGSMTSARSKRFTASAVRLDMKAWVPSLVDLTVETEKDCDVAAVNAAFKKAAEGPMKNVLAYSDAPIVSIDLKDDPHSAIVDAPLTAVIDKRLVKVTAWYDNEWGYSCRVRDLIKYIVAKGA